MYFFDLDAEQYNLCELRSRQIELLNEVIKDILISYTADELKQLIKLPVDGNDSRTLQYLLLNGYYDYVYSELEKVAINAFN